MTPEELKELKRASIQTMNEVVKSLVSTMNQRYYILDDYAHKLLEALKDGDAAKIQKAKDDLTLFLVMHHDG